MSIALHDQLAALFVYPAQDFPAEFGKALATMEVEHEELSEKLAPLGLHVAGSSIEEMEEAYTRTFDISASCTLELGWHIFGEDYNRGAFLVHVRQLMRAHGVEESPELPDHITHVIPLVARMSEEEGREFVHRFALPAMGKMIDGFSDLKNPYRPALEAVRDLLVGIHGAPEPSSVDAGVRAGPYTGMPGGMPTACSSPPEYPEFNNPMER